MCLFNFFSLPWLIEAMQSVRSELTLSICNMPVTFSEKKQQQQQQQSNFLKPCPLPHRSSDDVIGEGNHGGGVGDEVRHRLHDVPGVLPPGESGQEAQLKRT